MFIFTLHAIIYVNHHINCLICTSSGINIIIIIIIIIKLQHICVPLFGEESESYYFSFLDLRSNKLFHA